MSLSGLSAREAEASIQKYGLNERTADISFAEYFIGGLTSFSCKLFVIAAMVKIVALLLGLLEVTAPVKDVSGIFVFAGLALLCALFDAVVRYVSDKRIAEICGGARQSRYTALRGGKPEAVEEKMLAVGDVVYLSAGDIVPADGIVAEGSFIVDQSEFGTLEKAEKTTPPASFHGNRAMGLKNAHSIYKGSAITEGNGVFKITATGDNTLIAGKAADKIQIHGNSFEGLIRGCTIAGAVCATAVLVFCVIYGAASGQLVKGLLEGITATAVVLAVICLCGRNLIVEAAASGIMVKLDKQGVKISKPDVLNDMEDIVVAFVDRTGSYSDGNYSVNGFIDGTGKQIECLEEVNEKIVTLIKTAAVNTSSAYIDSDNTVYGGTAYDRAILEFVKKAQGRVKVKRQAAVRRGGISGVTVSLDGKPATFVSGSAELVLGKCSDSFSADGKKKRITNRDALSKLAATISLTGNDVTVFAVSDRAANDGKLPTGGYTLIGMLVVHDKLYENTAEALNTLEENKIRTILMTPASRETVIYTLKKAGKKSKGVILSSEQLAKMNDKELAKRFSDIRAVVNADSADKIRVMRAAAEQDIKSCVIGSDADNVAMVNETDTAIASTVCLSAMRGVSDASSEISGLTTAALLRKGAADFGKMCRIFISARALCSVLLAVMTVISIIRG